MKKKFLFSLLILPLMIGLASCGNKNNPLPPVPPVNNDEIKLPMKEMSLLLGEESRILPSYVYSEDPEANLSYKSDNIEVVTVDEIGNLKAIKCGLANITASYGKASAKCSVKVTLGSVVPLIRLNNIRSSSLNIDLLTTLDLSASVSFNNKLYEFEPRFNVDDLTVGKIEGTTFTPLKIGSCEIVISGTFENFALTPVYLTINVNESVYFTCKDISETEPIEKSQIDLFCKKTHQGKTYKNSAILVFSVFDNGKEKTNITVENLTPAVISYDQASGEVVALKAGVGQIKLSYRSESGVDYEKIYPVYVDYIVTPYGDKIFDVDIRYGELPLNEIFMGTPGDLNLVEAFNFDRSKQYTVSNNKITDLDFTNGNIYQIIVCNSTEAFVINVRVCTAIIKAKEDLALFHMETATDVNRGYYILANNIDATGYEHAENVRLAGASAKNFPDVGFLGVLDGQGYTISNLKLNRGGLLSNIGTGGVVKNLGMKNCLWGDLKVTGSDNAERYALATYINGGILQNLYIQADTIKDIANCALVAQNIMVNSTITNCLFVTPDEGQFLEKCKYGGVGSFTAMCYERKTIPATSGSFLVDCFVVSGLAMSRSATNASEKYYVDSLDYSQSSFTRYVYPNVKHYLTPTDMINAGNSYSSFDSDMWYNNNGMLEFKSAI